MSETGSPVCPCRLCAGTTTDARAWAREESDVRTRGRHVTGVAGGEELPDWAYTLGLWHSYRVPEVAMFGLHNPDMMRWADKAGALLRAGAPTGPDTLLDGVIDGFPVRLKPVDGSWWEPLFGNGLGFYRREPVPMVQLVWPDRDGAWPWEEAAGERCRAYQPRLWLPVAEHPEGCWTEEARSLPSSGPRPGLLRRLLDRAR